MLVSVISLSVGKRLMVNLSQVVKRTTTLPIPQQMASSTAHGLVFGSWVQIPPSTIINLFQIFPMSNLTILSPVSPGNETAWILTCPPVYPSALLLYPGFREGGGSVTRIRLGKLLDYNLSFCKRSNGLNTTQIP